jgi:hypothetical protein
LLVYFPAAGLYHAHHNDIGAMVIVGLFIADLRRRGAVAVLRDFVLLKLGVVAMVELAVLLGLHFYPVAAEMQQLRRKRTYRADLHQGKANVRSDTLPQTTPQAEKRRNGRVPRAAGARLQVD